MYYKDTELEPTFPQERGRKGLRGLTGLLVNSQLLKIKY